MHINIEIGKGFKSFGRDKVVCLQLLAKITNKRHTFFVFMISTLQIIKNSNQSEVTARQIVLLVIYSH